MDNIYNLNDFGDILDTNDVCKLLGICKNTLYNLIKERKIGYKKIGKNYKFPKIAIRKYLDSSLSVTCS